jgi:general L-amino acid transport system permease protein
MKAALKPLFGSPVNIALTAAMLALFYLTLPPFLHWALQNATWDGLSRKACAPDGACWAFVKARFPLFIYGRYPQPERWRVDLAFALLVLLSAGTLFAPRRRGWWLLALLVFMPIAGGVLLIGGVLGLVPVATGDWGGLMLNVVLTFVAVVGSLPFGIMLAFGRQSTLPLVRWGSIGFIELWRGSPLLAVLFTGLIMLPMFLPNGVTVDNMIRAIVVLTLFESAYMAETVRGALQGVPSGQTEAALAKAATNPDWSLEFAYQQRGPTFSNMISVQVSIDLPLFQKNRQNRDLAAKLALVDQARDLREDAIRQHLAEVQAVSADWDAATSRLKRFDESLLPLSQQRAEAALAAYRGGRGDLTPVLQARRDELDIKLQQLQLTADQARAYAQLLYFLPPEAVK